MTGSGAFFKKGGHLEKKIYRADSAAFFKKGRHKKKISRPRQVTFFAKRKKSFLFFLFEKITNKEMLLSTLLTKYGWLITNVPEILHSRHNWKFWFEGLSPLDVMNLKINVSGFRHHRRLIE